VTALVDMTGRLPVGFAVEIDVEAKSLRSGGWFGGSPPRVLRLTPSGAAAWEELRDGVVSSPRTGRLARRLTDAGIAHPVPPRATGRPDVTVVVPVRDRAVDLERCLASLGSDYPVVVVDDGSSDASAIRAVAELHAARVIRRDVNGGPAAARNDGVAASRGEFIALVDSDTVPGSEWIGALAAHFADPAVAAVAPRIVPLAANTSAGRYTRARCNLDVGSRPGRVIPYGRVSYVPSAALLVRRAAVDQVAGPDGPFDAALSVGEDVDLAWRLHGAGWRVRYDPSHAVQHREPATWSALLRRRYRYGTSTALLGARHPDAVAPLLVHPWSFACAGALALRRPVLALGALAGAALELRTALRAANVGEVPASTVTKGAVRGARLTWEGLGRYLIQFAPTALGAALLHRRTRLAAAGLLLAPVLAEWTARGKPGDPVRFAGGYLADEVAYGAGVLTACVRRRTTIPLRPRLIRRSF